MMLQDTDPMVCLLLLLLPLPTGVVTSDTVVLSVLPMFRSSPLTLTIVPPATGPNDGLTEYTLGSPNRNCAVAVSSAPPILLTVMTTSTLPACV